MAASPPRSVYSWEVPPTPVPRSAPDQGPDRAAVEALAAREIWRYAPSDKPAGAALEPLSADWFRYLADKRYKRHGRWAPKLLEFSKHANEAVVVLGDGLGCDAVQFALGGANVQAVDPSADRLRIYKAHFAAREVGHTPFHAPFDRLPFGDASVDVVFAFFNEAPGVSLAELFGEARRVLRPGGKLMAVLPARYNAIWWQSVFAPWNAWFRNRGPVSQRFTARELREAVPGLDELVLYKRHLRRSELPYLWRWVFLPVAERVMGRHLIVKGFKPLQAVGTVRIAA